MDEKNILIKIKLKPVDLRSSLTGNRFLERLITLGQIIYQKAEYYVKGKEVKGN